MHIERGWGRHWVTLNHIGKGVTPNEKIGEGWGGGGGGSGVNFEIVKYVFHQLIKKYQLFAIL